MNNLTKLAKVYFVVMLVTNATVTLAYTTGSMVLGILAVIAILGWLAYTVFVMVPSMKPGTLLQKGENKRTMRVRTYTRMEREYGYEGLYPHYYQMLQERRWWGWSTLDWEEVPGHVRIGIGAVGFDESKWQSKFAHFGRFGRNGIIQQVA